VALLGGCGGGPRVFNISPEAYRGPDLTIQSKPPQHVAIIQAPTPGWTFSFDASRPQFGYTDVFLTITRPNPAFVYTQNVVRRKLGPRSTSPVGSSCTPGCCPTMSVPDSQAYSRAAEGGPKPSGTSAPTR
jgi:hypothetical protein